MQSKSLLRNSSIVKSWHYAIFQSKVTNEIEHLDQAVGIVNNKRNTFEEVTVEKIKNSCKTLHKA